MSRDWISRNLRAARGFARRIAVFHGSPIRPWPFRTHANCRYPFFFPSSGREKIGLVSFIRSPRMKRRSTLTCPRPMRRPPRLIEPMTRWVDPCCERPATMYPPRRPSCTIFQKPGGVPRTINTRSLRRSCSRGVDADSGTGSPDRPRSRNRRPCTPISCCTIAPIGRNTRNSASRAARPIASYTTGRSDNGRTATVNRPSPPPTQPGSRPRW